jgi:hypothetical protein
VWGFRFRTHEKGKILRDSNCFLEISGSNGSNSRLRPYNPTPDSDTVIVRVLYALIDWAFVEPSHGSRRVNRVVFTLDDSIQLEELEL